MQGIGGFVPRVKLSLRMTRVSWRRHLLSFKWLVSGQEWGANLCLMQANPTDLWQRHASKGPGQALATSPVLPMILESFSFQSHLSVIFLDTRSRRKIRVALPSSKHFAHSYWARERSGNEGGRYYCMSTKWCCSAHALLSSLMCV